MKNLKKNENLYTNYYTRMALKYILQGKCSKEKKYFYKLKKKKRRENMEKKPTNFTKQSPQWMRETQKNEVFHVGKVPEDAA